MENCGGGGEKRGKRKKWCGGEGEKGVRGRKKEKGKKGVRGSTGSGVREHSHAKKRSFFKIFMSIKISLPVLLDIIVVRF